MSDVSLRKFAGQQTASGIDRRNLRGRCGRFDGRRAQVLHHDLSSRFGRLPRQGQAPQYEAERKARASRLQSHLPPGRGRVTRGRTVGRQTRWPTFTTVRRVPRGKESILVAATAFLFAEGVETGTSIGASHGGRLQPFKKHVNASVTKGCSTSQEEGSHLSPFAGTAYEREGRSFARGSSAHAHTSLSSRPSSAQPTVGFPESLRRRRQEERRSSALQPQVALCRFGEGVPGVAWLAARLLSKGKGAIASLVRRTSGRGKRGLSQRRRVETPPPPETRRSEDRIARGRARA
jgi:hypothetical protein